MISNERPSHFGHRSFGNYQKPQVIEETLKSEKLHIERKTFLLALKQNPRGRFLRITEDVGGRRDTIIIPAPGLEEFVNAIKDMVKVAAQTPEKVEPVNSGRKSRKREATQEPDQA
jgi:hypothetical protein